MTVRSLLGLVTAGFLLWNSVAARPSAMGMVLEADRAHLNHSKVTAGASIFDGDRFSTEAGGVLFLRGGGAMLELAEESELMVRTRPGSARGMEAELGKGTLHFHVAGTDELEVLAQGARICAATEAPTVGQVGANGLKDLRIYATRGAIQFSYRGETETIPEGESYRVVLDPSEDDTRKKGPYKAAKERKTFLFIAIAGGTVAGIGIYESRRHKHMESPDRP